MKLPVPFISGGEQELHGTATVEMVLTYYGVSYKRDEIIERLDESHGGTDMIKIAEVLLSYGFHTDFMTRHPALFGEDDSGASDERIRMIIKNHIEFAVGRPHDQIFLKHLLTYLDHGGCIHPAIPDFLSVKHELDRHRPVIALFATDYDVGGRSNLQCHPIVITGYSAKYIFLNDPLHKKRKILKEWFFNGIYASAHEMLDYGSMLLISPQKQHSA